MNDLRARSQFVLKMKPSEALAKQVIECVEAGALMVYRQDQSIRTHDFDLQRKAGATGAVEVTSINDAVVKAMYAAIRRHRLIPRNVCAKDWRIHPATDAVIKRIASDADIYLARIESDGVVQFFAPRDASRVPSVDAIWRELGIVSGRALPLKEPGISIALPITGGAYGPSLAVAAMQSVAATSDNLEKLAKSGAVERHLAIYVDHSATSVLMALRDLEPPEDPPDLPAEITHVWLFSETYGDNRYVVWRASNRSAWQRLALAGTDATDELVLVN